MDLTRRDVLAFRARAQQLGRDAGSLEDTAVLDLGVQDTGTDGAAWALALRGLPDPPADELVLLWTLRGAPHAYRRADVGGVAAATAPFSDADAAKRMFDAARPLKAAGTPALAGLDTVAARMREIVDRPTVKGELSTRLTAVLEEPYLRNCVPCGAVHAYEQPFRLAALRAGLELEPGTSPPVLRPIPGFAPAGTAPEHLDVVRGYLRLLGPATPAHVAGYVDAPLKEVKAHWPTDAVEVRVDGERRWVLAEDADRLTGEAPGGTLLLGSHDLFLQARDRATIVPDAARAKELWRIIGRPGAVLADGDVVGSWRARKAGTSLDLTMEPFGPLPSRLRAAVEAQAERLADHRGLTLRSLSTGD
ncbi:Winged helix DNA-binding domain-containing protein [Blastococcus aurantiacus]|uniref:Winged helix DNA-binding domain-containing protein n=1 Tax=Blastococcus aurantiacus TaxID=1550231 RepID=A0A1G7QAH9_9ACTN|nr:crosslink repair DNA glycosylase YcaQ family protein [Blastococcus aurantiacus]SDF95597.1 Winged helix DNA-binding domain-containing protein [Blastococcus aurantiacus]